MRSTAWVFLVLGLCFLVDAIQEEHKGVAVVYSPGRSARKYMAARAEDPVYFRQLMVYEWVKAGMALGFSLFPFRLDRRLDRTDPFSKNFAGKDALDDLDRVLADEERRRNEPLR